ncbi:VPA1267 family protein [Pseudomonas helleri]|uniref:VPA1267 family protein n=1 Tax=Pseudomonas helleri TaxID=1608996 RepID=UPI003FD2C1DF
MALELNADKRVRHSLPSVPECADISKFQIAAQCREIRRAADSFRGSRIMGNSKQNLQAFAEWAASKTHDEFAQMLYRGSLHREEIALACGFAKSVLRQNPAIKAQLQALEDRLRGEGVLPSLTSDDDNGARIQDQFEGLESRLADDAPNLQRDHDPNHDRVRSATDHVTPGEALGRRGTSSSLESTVRRLQSENASQRAEIQELRRQLSKLSALQEALSTTGRLPR